MNFQDIDLLVDTYGLSLYKFCSKIAGNRTDAEDLYQETFVKVMEEFHKIHMEGNPQSYLFSMAIYIWKSGRRKYARRQSIAPIISGEELLEQRDEYDLEDEVISQQLSNYINDEINKMDKRFRLPMYLFYTAELSVEEIAGILKIPSGTVRSRMYKARKLLKERLEAAGYE